MRFYCWCATLFECYCWYAPRNEAESNISVSVTFFSRSDSSRVVNEWRAGWKQEDIVFARKKEGDVAIAPRRSVNLLGNWRKAWAFDYLLHVGSNWTHSFPVLNQMCCETEKSFAPVLQMHRKSDGSLRTISTSFSFCAISSFSSQNRTSNPFRHYRRDRRARCLAAQNCWRQPIRSIDDRIRRAVPFLFLFRVTRSIDACTRRCGLLPTRVLIETHLFSRFFLLFETRREYGNQYFYSISPEHEHQKRWCKSVKSFYSWWLRWLPPCPRCSALFLCPRQAGRVVSDFSVLCVQARRVDLR